MNDKDKTLITTSLDVLKENFDDYVIPPCGNCRQMLYEYCPDIKVIVNDENGNLIKVHAKDLLPFS